MNNTVEATKMKDSEMFERNVWLTVYVKSIEQSKALTTKECADSAESAVQAYRKMFGDYRFTGEDRGE